VNLLAEGTDRSDARLDRSSNEFWKFLDCESCVLNDAAHREGIHGVRTEMPGIFGTYTVTSTSRTFAPAVNSDTTDKYSRMASRTLSSA
jgi:hypothetical protein